MRKFVFISDDINTDLNYINFKNVKNKSISNKPVKNTGLWASKFNNCNIWLSKYHELISKDHLQNPKIAFIFELKPDAKIYIIDTIIDLYMLAKDYNVNVDYIRRGMTLDFEKISEVYDAIYLTDDGQKITFDSYGINLSGWYSETILIFNMECVDLESVSTLYL